MGLPPAEMEGVRMAVMTHQQWLKDGGLTTCYVSALLSADPGHGTCRADNY